MQKAVSGGLHLVIQCSAACCVAACGLAIGCCIAISAPWRLDTASSDCLQLAAPSFVAE